MKWSDLTSEEKGYIFCELCKSLDVAYYSDGMDGRVFVCKICYGGWLLPEDEWVPLAQHG